MRVAPLQPGARAHMNVVPSALRSIPRWCSALTAGVPAVMELFTGTRHLAPRWRLAMGRYLLLWLLGVPIPILVLIWAFGGLH